MRFLLPVTLAALPASGFADVEDVLKQNCLALIAYQSAPRAFNAEASLVFEAFIMGSQLGKTADVMAAFASVCAESPDWTIFWAMRKAVFDLD